MPGFCGFPRLKAIQYPVLFGGRERQGGSEVCRSIPRQQISPRSLPPRIMAIEKIPCFWKRPAGNKPNHTVLEVALPHEMAGTTVMCHTHGRDWLHNLAFGDPVLIWGPLNKTSRGEYLNDPCPDEVQPFLASQNASVYVQPAILNPKIEQQPEQSVDQAERRISTKFKGSTHIDTFLTLAGSCSGHGEAGHLLMAFALIQVQDQVGLLPSHELRDYLRKALQRAGQPAF